MNTVRGSGFPEISLDELAIDFFSSGDRGRSASKNADLNSRKNGTASQRRGRSVSRHSPRTGGGGTVVDRGSSVRNGSVGGPTVSENNSRRRRSISVVRCPISDSEVNWHFLLLLCYRLGPTPTVALEIASVICYGDILLLFTGLF